MTVLAYKFLDADGLAPFTGAAWPVGEWVEAASAVPCHDGVHACRAGDVSHWIAASMWHVELDGEVVETTHKLVGSRGRLVAPVDGYDAAIRGLRELSAWRSRDHAVALLRASGDDALADRFAAATSLAELAALGAAADDAAHSGRAAALAADCAHFAIAGVHAQAPFVAACAAGHAASGLGGDQAAFDAGYAAERHFQSEWLTDRLSLA